MGLNAVAKRLVQSAQASLPLQGGKGTNDAGIKAAGLITTRGPRGEYYVNPKEFAQQQELWSHLRRLIDEGQVSPVLNMNTAEIPYKQVAKVQKSMDLAQSAKERGLPGKRSFMSPEFDALSLKLNQQGTRADAIAALQGPQTTQEGSMYLNDLAASDVPGAGGDLLRSLLKGPLFPEAREMLFTPINTDDTMNFYRKFGMRYLSPDEAVSDDRIRRVLESVDELRNAKDLGVGIIERKRGGLVKMAEGGQVSLVRVRQHG